jgi:hypothetical protein
LLENLSSIGFLTRDLCSAATYRYHPASAQLASLGLAQE